MTIPSYTASGSFILFIPGLLFLLYGAWQAIRQRQNARRLILWGAVHDAGLICMALGAANAAAGTGVWLFVAFQLLAPPWPAPLAVLYKIASCCGVVAVCYGVAGVRSFARLCGWYAALNGLLCGAVVLPGVQANNLSVLLPVRPGQLLLCCAGVYGLLRGLLAVFGRPQRGCFAAVLQIAGATVPVQAYHDTGFTTGSPPRRWRRSSPTRPSTPAGPRPGLLSAWPWRSGRTMLPPLKPDGKPIRRK